MDPDVIGIGGAQQGLAVPDPPMQQKFAVYKCKTKDDMARSIAQRSLEAGVATGQLDRSQVNDAAMKLLLSLHRQGLVDLECVSETAGFVNLSDAGVQPPLLT